MVLVEECYRFVVFSSHDNAYWLLIVFHHDVIEKFLQLDAYKNWINRVLRSIGWYSQLLMYSTRSPRVVFHICFNFNFCIVFNNHEFLCYFRVFWPFS